ncbi:MAG TPA: type II toxin-antitoxin system VapC family toxin [Gemmataceae bacterium]|nr:type II toxin-antitoxin system VapC family toxin [Gemmataceae bacterium]
MFFLLWDASALAQRYAPEIGHLTVNALFTAVSPAQLVTTVLSYSETCGALVRKHNGGALDAATFAVARSALRAEVIDDADFGVLAVDFADILGGIDLIDRHNLNSADASILVSFLAFAQAQPATTVCILVAADQRLLRAAQAEGLRTLNPELITPADVPAFLASL